MCKVKGVYTPAYELSVGAIVMVVVEAATLAVIDSQGYDSSIVKLAYPHSVAVENVYIVAACPTVAV